MRGKTAPNWHCEADQASLGARSEPESHAMERRKTFRGSLCHSMTKGHVAALDGLVQAVLPAIRLYSSGTK